MPVSLSKASSRKDAPSSPWSRLSPSGMCTPHWGLLGTPGHSPTAGLSELLRVASSSGLDGHSHGANEGLGPAKSGLSVYLQGVGCSYRGVGTGYWGAGVQRVGCRVVALRQATL